MGRLEIISYTNSRHSQAYIWKKHRIAQKFTLPWQAPWVWSHSEVMRKIPQSIAYIFAALISSFTSTVTSDKGWRKEQPWKPRLPLSVLTKSRWLGPEASADVTYSFIVWLDKGGPEEKKSSSGCLKSSLVLPNLSSAQTFLLMCGGKKVPGITFFV